MGILNLSKAPQVTKTGIEGIRPEPTQPSHCTQPRVNAQLKKQVEIQKVRQQMPSTGHIYEKMPLHGNFALYRNDRQMHRAQVRLELTNIGHEDGSQLIPSQVFVLLFILVQQKIMGTIALEHYLSSRHPFLISASCYQVGKYILTGIKLQPTSCVQWKRGRDRS